MARLTEKAYIKGLNEGFALGKAEYINLNKTQVKYAIEASVCRWCPNYKGGKFSGDCATCKVSECYQTIDLMEV